MLGKKKMETERYWKNGKPTVSIITPTFNFQDYIGESIQSVISQTFTSWEMIIVDDKSTDLTVPIVNNYVKLDSRIKLIQHNKNWGIEKLKETYNQALKISQGKYIAILEGDDFWPINKLESQLKNFKNRKVVLSFGDSIFTDRNGRGFDILNYKKKLGNLNNISSHLMLKFFSDFDFYLSPVTVLINKKILLKIGGFQNNSYYYFVDFPTWLHLSLEGDFAYEKNIMGFYRRHKKSNWLNFAKKTKSMTRNEMQNVFIEFLNKKSKILESKRILLNPQEYIDRQNKFILKKRENREFSFLLHSLAYEDNNEIVKNIKLILSLQNKHLKIVFFALVIFLLIPIRKQIMFLFFEFKYGYYKLLHLVKLKI